MDVGVDLGELPRRVAGAVVASPAAQYRVEVLHDSDQVDAHELSAGPDLTLARMLLMARVDGQRWRYHGPSTSTDSTFRRWNPKKSKPSFPRVRSTILVLSGCSRSPRGARIAAARCWAASARWRVGHTTTKSSAVTDQHSQPPALSPPTPRRGRGGRCSPAAGKSVSPAGFPPPCRRPPRPRTPRLAASISAASTSAGRQPGARPEPSGRRGRSRRSTL